MFCRCMCFRIIKDRCLELFVEIKNVFCAIYANRLGMSDRVLGPGVAVERVMGLGSVKHI